MMRLWPFLILFLIACASPPQGPINAQIVGHGGMGNAQQVYPLNSLEGVRELCRIQNKTKKVYGVELDVQLTKDDALVLYHDETIKVNNENKAIRAFLLKDLPKKNDTGLTVIPSLAAILGNGQCHAMHFFLDVKLHHHAGDWGQYLARFSDKLAQEITTLHAAESVTIECQDPVFLKRVKEQCSTCRSFLYLKSKAQVARLLAGTLPHAFIQDLDGVTIRSDKIDESLVRNLQAAGLAVAVFGCSGVRGNVGCTQLGADYVQTEDVELIANWK